MHLLAGLLISFATALSVALANADAAKAECAAWGMLAAVMVGLLKEVFDFARGEQFDVKDWAFTAVGGAIGALMYLM